jgi:glycosyltransferase involved in cell wall biosynthesis
MAAGAAWGESAVRADARILPQPPKTRPLRRIVFVNRYFFPDHSATSQILGDLAFHLAGRGHPITVITSRQRYDEPRARLQEKEEIGGVCVERLAGTGFARSSLFGRGCEDLSFYRSARRAILASARRGDILVAKTDPPLLSVAAMLSARAKGLILVNWLQDLYPETAARLGVPFLRGPLLRGLLELRDSALRAAARNVVVGEAMGEILRSRGLPANRIAIIPNWCDDEEIRPLAACENPLRRLWGLEDRFVVGYCGNLGRAHEFDTVVAAAERLGEENRVLFLFVGGGNRLGELARRVAERRLSHLFRFVPYQERAMLKYSLSLPDIHWISLRPEVEGLIFPSKIYGIAAAGRPAIVVGARGGELARLVCRHRCGVAIAAGEGTAFAHTLRRLAADRGLLEEMGRRARGMIEAHFRRRHAFERWRGVLQGIL